jgi:site-specific DNA-methyltransferase (adenine-specific)
MLHDWKNKLHFGNNLDILREHIKDESIDLIYLDPPFNSAANYNIIFKETSGAQSAAQITAFEDTWHWGQESEEAYHALINNRDAPEDLIKLIQALRDFLGDNDMMAYLIMMAPRIVELHRVLKPQGSIYLHCDPTADAYLRIMMDAIFTPRCFRNEIIWSYRRWPSKSKAYQTMHDVILFYAKTPSGPGTFHIEYEANSPSYDKRFGGKTQMLDPETRTRKITLEEESKGLARRDVWDISIIAGSSRERLGYPTQKPLALLERIIKTSSNEGDIVLDPFCGCGTTVTVAERWNRKWIGIDITHLAVSLIKNRLHDAFKTELTTYEVIGDPKDHASAEALALQDRYQFQWWAVGLVEGRPAQDKKKGKDTGIDGNLYFFDDQSGKAKRIIIQVKSGNVKSGDIRDLKGVLEREKAELGAFISLKPATRDMIKEAVSAGFYESMHYGKFPKLQILTVEEILDGAKLQYPQTGASGTFKRAERQSKSRTEQDGLF